MRRPLRLTLPLVPAARAARVAAIVACVCASLVAPARAVVSAVGPFTGDRSDTFDQYSTNMAVLALDIFGGAGEIRIHGDNNSIKVEFSSQLGGDLVVPVSGMMMGQLGVADWNFDVPVGRFGGYWENNSGADHATVRFFDAGDNLLGTAIATVPRNAQQWTWNGWESDTPIARINVVGNGLINGFIWYENVQIDVVPEPAAAGLAVAAVLLGSRRFRR